MAKLLFYQQNNSIYFVVDDGVNPLDYSIGTFPANSIAIKIDSQNEDILIFSRGGAGNIDTEIIRWAFSDIADKNGIAYSGSNAAEVLDSINLTVGQIATSGGGGGGATEANQQLQIDEATFQTNIQASTLPSIRLSNLDTAAATTQVANNQINGNQTSKGYFLAVDYGQITDHFIIRRVDKNIDIDTAGLPEMVTFLGGFYTGHPVSGFGAIQVISSSALDIGFVKIKYLATQASTEYQEVTFAVNGTTAVNTSTGGNSITAYRVISAEYSSTANVATQFNAGTITVRYIATPAVAFLAIPAGRNISHGAIYTVPQGKKAILLPTTYRVNNVSGAVLECGMYIREYDLATNTYSAPKICFNATVTAGTPLRYEYEGGIVVKAGTDISAVVYLSSTNNVTIEVSYSILVFNA